MRSNINFAGFTVLVSIVLLSACTPRKVVVSEGEFMPSNRNAAEILASISPQQTPVERISGRGRAQYSGPGSSERSTVQFNSDRNTSLLIFRNSLGIEGGRLLVEPDSVTFYNRVDQFAQKFSTANQDVLFDNGFYAVNMLQVLNPDLDDYQPRRVLESNNAWMIIFDDQTSMVFEKSSGNLLKIEYSSLSNIALTTYHFGNYTEISGFKLPRSVQITSRDKQSNIFLNIQSYEVNPASIDLTLNIPSHITIIRQ